MKRKRSLKVSLTLKFLLLATLPVISVGLFTLISMTRSLEDDIRQRNLILAKTVSDELTRFLNEPVENLNQLAAAIADGTVIAESATNEYLEILLDSHPYFESILILDSEGLIKHLAPFHKDLMNSDMTGQPYYQTALPSEPGKMLFSKVFISSRTGQPTLTITRKIKSGMIIGYLDLAALDTIVQKITIGKKGYAAIADSDGTILAHMDRKQVEERFNVSSLDLYEEAREQGEGTFLFRLANEEKLGSVSIVPLTGWMVLVIQPVDDAFAPVNHMRNVLLVGVVLSLVLAIAFAVYSLKKTLNPVQALTKNTEEIATGDYTFHAPPESYYEIDRLSEKFGLMMEEIRTREINIKQSEEQLKNSNKLLQAILDGVPDIIGLLNPDFSVLQYNQAGYEELGMTPEEVHGKKCFELIGREEICRNCATSKALLSGKTEETERFVEQFQKHMLCRSIPVPDDAGNVSLVIEQLHDITYRKQAEDALKESERSLKRAHRMARMGSWSYDMIRKKGTWSDEFYQIFGKDKSKYPEGEVPDSAWLSILENPSETESMIADLMERYDSFEYDYITVPINGERKIIHSYSELERDPHGNVIRIFGSDQDITEQKRAEEQLTSSLREKETLLHEIHHRVKNNMQIIASLLKLQLNRQDKQDVDAILKENIGRVYSMATIHESLHQSEKLSEIDFNIYLQRLSHMLSLTYLTDPGNVSFRIHIPGLTLNIEKANPLGLVMNELISNSLKYAFPGDRKGTISIQSAIRDQSDVEIIVSDNGTGLPEKFDWQAQNSLGLRLVRDIVERQLDGSIDYEHRNGARFVIKFNLVR